MASRRNSLVSLQATIHAQKTNSLGALRRNVSRSRQALLNNPGPSRRSHSGFPATESSYNASAKSAKRSRRATGNAFQKSPGLQRQGRERGRSARGRGRSRKAGSIHMALPGATGATHALAPPSRYSLGRSEPGGGLLEAAPRSARGIGRYLVQKRQRLFIAEATRGIREARRLGFVPDRGFPKPAGIPVY